VTNGRNVADEEKFHRPMKVANKRDAVKKISGA
jgi:hypothetical protein